jgi:hypothetical protein
MIDSLLDLGVPLRRHKQIVIDDFSDAPVLELYGQVLNTRTITACETPSSIFASLPIVLDQGYSHLVLGHEASANFGNLVWSSTGEVVNHQWGKSIEAERLLDTYLREELVADLGMFSLLKPLHDVLIFELARLDKDSLFATQSCNVRKPWCKRCSKCAYVWLGFRAHLDSSITDAIFREDLLEAPENLHHFRGLCGLTAHTPFECIGRVEESRLAIALLQARGLLGPLGAKLAEELPTLVLEPALLKADFPNSAIPEAFAAALQPMFSEAERTAAERIAKTLGS